MRRIISIAMLANTALLAACGNKSASDSAGSADASQYIGAPASNTAASASGSSSSPSCPTAADVKAALGFEVRDLTRGMKRYGPLSSCGYAASDDNAMPGVTVTFTIEPAGEADQRFSDMRTAVTTARGKATEPDPITVGERGMAFRTSSRTMAAAVKGGQLYSVEVRYGAMADFGDKQEGTVTLLKKLVGTTG